MKKIVITTFLLVISFAIVMSYSISATEKGVWVKSIDASSMLEPGKGAYDQGNIMDLTDDSWCEGKKDGGIGESITIKLDSPMAMKMLYIKNGMGVSKYWAANNRVKEVKINDAVYTLKDDPGFQAITLKGKASDTLTLSIVSVYKGEKWNDTCLAEVAFDDPGDAFNRRDNFQKIVGKMWETSELMPGNGTTFARGFLFSSDSIPCGDETCPNTTIGSCKPQGKNTYQCRLIENCRGTYDPRLNKAGRVCTSENDVFTLDVSSGSPVVTVKGKKTKLAPFN